MVQNTKPKSKPTKAKEPAKEAEPKVEEEKQEEPDCESCLPNMGDFLEHVLPAVKGLMSKPKPEVCDNCCDDYCDDDRSEVHIIGSEEMILKLFGKA